MKIVDKPPLNKNVPNFEILHKLWSKECSHMLEILTDHKFDDTDDININIVKTGISNVLKILTGEDGIFAELANSQPWYSTFVSTLFYQSPTVTIQDIPFNLQEFFRKICPNVKDNLNQLDTIIISIFELDHFSVLTELCQYNNDWWFPAHVSDLFARILDLKTPCVKADCDLREYIILEFVSNFSDHGSLWSIMPIYLDACVKFGKAHLQIYLSKMSLDNEFKAHKIMELCEERNFSLLVRSICRQMATNYININQYGSALHWAFNGKDFDMSDYIVLKILNSNENLKENTHFNVVGNLGRYSHETSLLAYLTKVKEMVDLYEEKSYDKVETLILTLLNQPLPSASFGFVLLRFIGEFLNQTSIKDPHAIYELMRWVGETFSLKPVDSLREDQKLFIRLVVQALSQNLSATFVKREPIFCMSQDTNIKENENQIYTI
ncbi:nuclear pore complex protein Nup85-like [Gordionus sp. m RMFG-2023]|uniref:nuclear pore complex protein Nup85-like n=1 Tax=Gordionus sp. m RMFG-2023 TaxID=3053472 RepID=UPI0031FCE26C